jgi:hypothetical protein
MLSVCHAFSAGGCGVRVNTICAAVGDRNSCVNQLLGHWIKRAWGCHDRFDVAPGRLQQIQIEREIIPEVVDKVAALVARMSAKTALTRGSLSGSFVGVTVDMLYLASGCILCWIIQLMERTFIAGEPLHLKPTRRAVWTSRFGSGTFEMP